MRILLALNYSPEICNPRNVMHCLGANEICENIRKVSLNYDYFIIINDKHHKSDVEFSYLPPHALEFGYFPYESKHKNLQILTKNTLSGVASEHNLKTILNFQADEIDVCGYTTSLDVFATLFDLTKHHKKVSLIKDGTSDLTIYNMEESLKLIAFMGIGIK